VAAGIFRNVHELCSHECPGAAVGFVLQEITARADGPKQGPGAKYGHRGCCINKARPNNNSHAEITMLKWALIFALISIVAAVFGFTGIAAGAAGVAKILFVVAVAIFLVFLALGLFVVKKVAD
jgi:uncharacterized membrane protein YtjA (UPF0391 family)